MNDPLRIQWYSTGQEIPFDAGDLPMFTAYQVVAQVGEYDGEMVYAAEKHDFTEWGPKQWTADNKRIRFVRKSFLDTLKAESPADTIFDMQTVEERDGAAGS